MAWSAHYQPIQASAPAGGWHRPPEARHRRKALLRRGSIFTYSTRLGVRSGEFGPSQGGISYPNGQTTVRGRHLAAKAQHHVSSRLLRRSRATVPAVRCCQRRAEPASSMGNLRHVSWVPVAPAHRGRSGQQSVAIATFIHDPKRQAPWPQRARISATRRL
jgi:hypothetical protein